MARHVRLIGKATVGGSVGEPAAGGNQPAGMVESPHGQEAVRTGAAELAELPRQFKTVEPGFPFEIGGIDRAEASLAQALAVNESARSLHRGAGGNVGRG